MRIRIRTILAAIGAFAVLSTMSGCIFPCGGYGGGRGHCGGGHWGHGR